MTRDLYCNRSFADTIGVRVLECSTTHSLVNVRTVLGVPGVPLMVTLLASVLPSSIWNLQNS